MKTWDSLDMCRYNGQRILKMELLGTRKRERPQKKFMTAVTKEDGGR